LRAGKQGFRLDKKLQLKIERKDFEERTIPRLKLPPKVQVRFKAKSPSKTKATTAQLKRLAPIFRCVGYRMIVRLDFSDHEKALAPAWLNEFLRETFQDGESKVFVRWSDLRPLSAV